MKTITAKKWQVRWQYIGTDVRFQGKNGTEEVTAESKGAAEVTVRGIASKAIFGSDRQHSSFEAEAQEIKSGTLH